MNSIPENHSEIIWDGFLGFDAQFAPSSLFIIPSDQSERTLFEKDINLPIEFVDVMAGPINFQKGSAE